MDLKGENVEQLKVAETNDGGLDKQLINVDHGELLLILQLH